MKEKFSVEDVARICHEANRVLCSTIDDYSQYIWELAEDWQKESAVNGVLFRLNNPTSRPRDSHANWMEEKERDGWVHGEVKDAEKKTHPCMVPYRLLPPTQRAKDYLFVAIVDALSEFMEEETPRGGE